MRNISRCIATLSLVGTAIIVTAQAAIAAPRQVVVIVSEGLGPQVMEVGTSYLNYIAQVTAKAEEGDVASVPISDMISQAKMQSGGASLASLKGLLHTAARNGYRTGLVSSGDVTTAAGLFYDVPGDASAIAATLVKETKFDFLGGGGRAYFIPQSIPGSLRTDDMDASQLLRQTGGTPLLNAESAEDASLEIKGRALALQSETSLSYAIDQDPFKEAGLGELANLAMQTLAGESDAPYMLIVHDTLLAKAAAAKDTPALIGQFRELNGIVADALAMRMAKDNPADFGIALLGTGNAIAPRFTSDKADERSNALYVVSQLGRSYSGAGSHLKGADDATLTAFATDDYKGWKLSPETRAAILNGTLAPETAIRASYEPAIAINFTNADSQPVLYTLGLDITGDLASSLMNLKPSKTGAMAAAPAM